MAVMQDNNFQCTIVIDVIKHVITILGDKNVPIKHQIII